MAGTFNLRMPVTAAPPALDGVLPPPTGPVDRRQYASGAVVRPPSETVLADNQLSGAARARLRLAASWGLLADLDGLRFELRGEFSLHKPDLADLIVTAGGRLDTVNADVLVAADDLLAEGWFSSLDQEKHIWSEAQLVLAMIPKPFALRERVTSETPVPF